MSTIKISIIVPIYNSDKYLEETLESLVNQSLKEIEIILVNDGSTDNSKNICKKYKERDNRIIYIEQKNSGPSTARNRGISIATGKYIGFCDSDDIPNMNMYEILYNYALNENYDMAICDIYSERSKIILGLPYNDGQVLNREMIQTDLIPKMIGRQSDDAENRTIWGSVVRCIYKKKIIDNNEIIFPEDISFAEDLIFTLRVLSCSHNIVICNQALYFYRLNRKSLMMSHQKYQQGMFEKRKKLTNYIGEISFKLNMTFCYEKNRLVSFREYMHECIGNACRKSGDRTIIHSYNELKEIVNDEAVISAFKSIDSQKFSRRVVYKAIQKKQCLLLLTYYKIRFLGK